MVLFLLLDFDLEGVSGAERSASSSALAAWILVRLSLARAEAPASSEGSAIERLLRRVEASESLVERRGRSSVVAEVCADGNVDVDAEVFERRELLADPSSPFVPAAGRSLSLREGSASEEVEEEESLELILSPIFVGSVEARGCFFLEVFSFLSFLGVGSGSEEEREGEEGTEGEGGASALVGVAVELVSALAVFLGFFGVESVGTGGTDDEESEVEGFLEESVSVEEEEGEEDEATGETSTTKDDGEEETTGASTGVTEEVSFGVVVSVKTVATLVERGLSFLLTEAFEGDFLVELMTESKSSIENFWPFLPNMLFLLELLPPKSSDILPSSS